MQAKETLYESRFRRRTMEHMTTTRQARATGWLRPGSRLVLFAFLAIGGFFLITEHAAHLFGILPYLLLLLCPLLHLLHGGHGGGHGRHDHPEGGKQ
jgi:hypothetical protein